MEKKEFYYKCHILCYDWNGGIRRLQICPACAGAVFNCFFAVLCLLCRVVFHRYHSWYESGERDSKYGSGRSVGLQ